MVKVQPGHCPSSAPVPRQGAPDGLGPLGPLGAPRERPAHWAPRHGLGRSSGPRAKPPMPRPSAHQVHLRSCGVSLASVSVDVQRVYKVRHG